MPIDIIADALHPRQARGLHGIAGTHSRAAQRRPAELDNGIDLCRARGADLRGNDLLSRQAYQGLSSHQSQYERPAREYVICVSM